MREKNLENTKGENSIKKKKDKRKLYDFQFRVKQKKLKRKVKVNYQKNQLKNYQQFYQYNNKIIEKYKKEKEILANTQKTSQKIHNKQARKDNNLEIMNSIPNHFSYLFENKCTQPVNKKKAISKSKDDTFKVPLKKKKQNDVFDKNNQKEEYENESSLNDNNLSSEFQSSGKNKITSQNIYSSSYLSQIDENKQIGQYKMEYGNQNTTTQYFQNISGQSQLQKNYSQIQQEQNKDINNSKQIMTNENKDYSLYKNQQQFAHKLQNDQINHQERKSPFQGIISSDNIVKKINNQQSQPTEVIFWRRANQLQTKFQTAMRQTTDSNQLLLKGDLCFEMTKNGYNTDLTRLPLSSYKRITSIKKYHEGKVEIQVVTDVKETNNQQQTKHEEGAQNNQNFTSIEQQINDYQQKIDMQKSIFSLIKQQSSNIIDNLKDHVSMKKQQFLNKIDFERKYIFAVEFQMDEQEGISQINKVYYSKSFLNIMGLDSKDSSLMEAYLLKNGVIDLHESLGLYNNKKESKGELISQYLEPITSNYQKLNTLDNLQVCVTINHRIINLSEEFLHMFSDIGLENISKEYFVLYELDIPYDQIKQIENDRKSIEKGGIPSFFINDSTPNQLLKKYYSMPQLQNIYA